MIIQSKHTITRTRLSRESVAICGETSSAYCPLLCRLETTDVSATPHRKVRYSPTAAQIISRFAHRGSVESERVLRLLWDLNRRIPLCGESELVLVQSRHSTRCIPLSKNC